LIPQSYSKSSHALQAIFSQCSRRHFGGLILWALVIGKINSDDAQRLFKQLVQ
jgi:hypothetical protein